MIRKRIFDIACVLPAVLILLPIFAAIAIWIKLDSHGPVFFRQTRIGQHEKAFKILKFRTMIVDAENHGSKITIGNDPRITKCGRVLRNNKLDELPQLFNVLIGDMSLVGPRPEVPDYVVYYPSEIRRAVYSIKPGITDLASIKFKNECDLLAASDNPQKTYVDEILPVKLKYNLDYINNQSLLGDIKLILRTIIAICIK